MKTTFFISIIMLLLGCRESTTNNLNEVDGKYYESLLEQNLFLVNDTILIGLDDSMVCISKKTPFVLNSRVMLNEKGKNGTFTDKDFNSMPLLMGSAAVNKNKIIFYGIKNIDVSFNTRVRIGEYYLNDDFKKIKIWNTDFDYTPIEQEENLKRATMFLGTSPKTLYMNYAKDKGIFFKTSGELFLWFVDNTVFFIRKKTPNNKRKVMFHILTGNKFQNLDFDFSSKLSKKLLLSNSYEVAEIKVPKEIFSYGIRIGEYAIENSNIRNIWAQEIEMAEVKKNELLKFQGEIEEAKAE